MSVHKLYTLIQTFEGTCLLALLSMSCGSEAVNEAGLEPVESGPALPTEGARGDAGPGEPMSDAEAVSEANVGQEGPQQSATPAEALVEEPSAAPVEPLPGEGMQAVSEPSDGGPQLDPFSFFVTGMEGLRRLSGSQDGFGGDLRYGEADGLTGADKICTQLAEHSMPGASSKQWRAFLSVGAGPDGQPVHAIERVGEGPWYDRLGRIVAMTAEDLTHPRPRGADPSIIDDLPNEYGVPNKQPDPNDDWHDNHHMLTGSDENGRLYQGGGGSTCEDWTTAVPEAGRPRMGFAWPRARTNADSRSGYHWLTTHDGPGCGAGVDLAQAGRARPGDLSVGGGGGYGGFYCFALTP